MTRLMRPLFAALLMLLSCVTFAQEEAAAPSAATLGYMNRDIFVFRAELAGASPGERATRARARIEEAERRNIARTVSLLPLRLGDHEGVGVFAADLLLFTVLPGDVNPEEFPDKEVLAESVKQQLEAAFVAWHAQQDPVRIGEGLLKTGIAGLLAFVAIWLVWRLRGWLTIHLQGFVARKLKGSATWVAYLAKLFERVILILIGLLLFSLVYLWLTYALAQFPLTQPFGKQLGSFLLDLLSGIGSGFVRALPDLVTLLVIVLITRALAQSVAAIFDAVRDGRIQLPGLHRETLGATRRIVIGAIWALGITFCYPYIPGSQSNVFKGLSVLFGFMFTLGSAGIVSQLMSGMTLVYSRALRRGDLVQIGETTGVVQEVGALSTKIKNIYNEEITIPNAVIVSNQIRNLTKLHEMDGVHIGSKITIGYDTPWRQVHAMMINAALRVPGLKAHPAPYVLQRALSDFYVEYELIAALDDPFVRAPVLSQLHAEIQDEFNTYGVQIMSPNFEAQPDTVVLVPKEEWFKAPAQPAPSRLIPD